MASTIITTNADALKRAARDISGQAVGLSPNRVLNTLSRAIAGPGQNWGFIKGTPTGHYVQPGLSAPTAQRSPWLLAVEGSEPIYCASRGEALDAFAILAENAENRVEAERQIFTTGRAVLEHPDHPSVRIELLQAGAGAPRPKSIFSTPPVRSGQPLTPQILDCLRGLLTDRRSMLISGATGTGKTSLLSTLSFGIPGEDKVVCIESHPEIHISRPNLTNITAKKSSDGPYRHDYAGALTSAARMKPDWIVLGEVAEPDAFVSLVELGNAGHCFAGTLHAASAAGAVMRMEDALQGEMPHRPLEEIRRDIARTQFVSVCLHRSGKGWHPPRIEAVTVTVDGQGAFVFNPIEF